MIDWDLISGSGSTSCSSDKEAFIKEIQDNTSADLTEFVTNFDIKIGMPFFKQEAAIIFKDSLEEVVIPCLIEVEAGKDIIQNSITRVIKYSSEYVLHVGDYVKHKTNYCDNAEEKIYLIHSEPIPKRGYFTAYLVECTHCFNMLTKDGEFVTVPFYTDDNKIILRDSDISVIRNNDVSTTWITVPDNKCTRMLNNELKRIMVDKLVFKVIGISYVNSVRGNFIVGIQTTESTEMDDFDRGLAYNKYFDNISNEEDQRPVEDVTIIGEDTIGIGCTEPYEINYDCDSWIVSNSNVIVKKSESRSCLIYVNEKKLLIGKVFTLTAKIGDIEYQKEITIGE